MWIRINHGKIKCLNPNQIDFSVDQNGTIQTTTISLTLLIDGNTAIISKRMVKCSLEFTVLRSLTLNETSDTGLVFIFAFLFVVSNKCEPIFKVVGEFTPSASIKFMGKSSSLLLYKR